jgi:23S rRNA (uridine2552-2'-O)-methyltransferase
VSEDDHEDGAEEAGKDETAKGDDKRRRRRKSTAPNTAQAGGLRQRVKTARGRKLSSTRWLDRQLNDPYVRRAKDMGYRSRAAFKLVEIDERFRILKPGMKVIDLGAAPGGWLQVALGKGASAVVGIDLLEIEPVSGAEFLQADFMDERARNAVRVMIGDKVDVVLSDMAANTTGHRETDHLRIVALVELAADFARELLKPGGSFIAKVFQGGTSNALLDAIKRDFTTVRHFKPPASRDGSPETYLIAMGFRATFNNKQADQESASG